MSEVKVRFAPSPTGYLHIGGLRTALFNYLYARHHKGSYVIRIEDTDRTRFVEGALENLLKVMAWAGLENDEGPILKDGKVIEKGDFGPYIQSKRHEADLYRKYADQLLNEGKAYYCFCSKERLDRVRQDLTDKGMTPRYDGHCRDLSKEEVEARIKEGQEYVIRMKLPENEDITFNDAVKGKITINTDEMDDQVLIKSDGFPTYHFAVVIDDHLMGISHIVRGEEWISSTPKHVILYRFFGWQDPIYVHLPTVLGSDHKKLSKRNGDSAVEQYIEKGYLPEALINYIALLGWSPKSNQEIMSKEELINQFDFDRISKTGGIFDVKKLNYFNQEYIKKLNPEQVAKYIRPFLEKAGLIGKDCPEEKLIMTAELYGNRLEYFEQIVDNSRHLFQNADELVYDDDAIEALASEKAPLLVKSMKEKIEGAEWNEDFTAGLVKQIQKETGIKGKELWFPIRSALIGQTSGPDFGKTLDILGKEESLDRIKRVEREGFLG